MDKDVFLQNITAACAAMGTKPTPACISAGVGKDMATNIRNGKIPSVAKVAQLAAYLGVTTSDLVGDKRPDADADEARLLGLYDDLNEEGRERLIEYAEDLTASGRYKKADTAQLGEA